MTKKRLKEDEVERIIENFEPCFYIYWDSGNPGAGAEFENIYKYKEGYCPILSSEEEVFLYSTLEEALRASELLNVNDCVDTVFCNEKSAEELSKMLKYEGGEDHIIFINKTKWKISEKEIMKID